MNDRQYLALWREIQTLRMVLVHFLARQSPEELAALAADIDRKPELRSPDVEDSFAPMRAMIDDLLVQAKVVQRQLGR